MENVEKILKILQNYDNVYDMIKQFAVSSEGLNEHQLAILTWELYARMCDEFEDTMWEEARKAYRILG